MKILVVEDEKKTAAYLRKGLLKARAGERGRPPDCKGSPTLRTRLDRRRSGPAR
jgi:hypothetical protein